MSSTWEIKSTKKYPKLTQDIKTDVVIIGGGLAGIWVSYMLKDHMNVVLVEKNRLGQAVTQNTTAFLTEDIDTNLSNLIKIFGEKTAGLIWKSHKEAIDLVEETLKKEKIECEFHRTPLRVFAESEKDFQTLKEEHESSKRIGFKTSLNQKPDIGFENVGVWEHKNQAKFHPLKFLLSLAKIIEQRGVKIFEETEAISIDGNGPFSIKTGDNKTISASWVVICSYEPLNNTSTHFKKGMYKSYVLEANITKNMIPEGIYIDMKNPYNYFRIDPNISSDRLIFGGADHRYELKIPPGKNFKALENRLKELFKGINIQITKKWAGPILESSDGLALIGEIEEGQYVASAFSGNGMTYAVIAGRLIADLIMGKKNPYTKIYDPRRTMNFKALVQKARDYGEEFFGGAMKNFLK